MRINRTRQPVVSFVTLILNHYRVPFHNRVRQLLGDAGIEYRLIYSDPCGAASTKNDTVDLDWATKVPVRRFALFGREVFWQDARGLTAGSDLIVVSQENKLLLNYWLQARQFFGGAPLAFFGHGRNRQASRPNGLSERIKRILATRVHWWFAYTSGVARLLRDYGFPADRITVNRNAIDTSALKGELDSIDEADIAALKQRYAITSDNIGVYVGGLYPEKRIPFLIEAADRIRRLVPDFELVVIGSGPHGDLVKAAAREAKYIHAPGPLFGREKATHLKMARVFLMPGLVGLGVLDSFAAGTPIVTTDVDYHSPEIEYLEDGTNGLVVKPSDDVQGYAQAVARLLIDGRECCRLARGAQESAALYTIENMAHNFAGGVIAAVARPTGERKPRPARTAGSPA